MKKVLMLSVLVLINIIGLFVGLNRLGIYSKQGAFYKLEKREDGVVRYTSDDIAIGLEMLNQTYHLQIDKGQESIVLEGIIEQEGTQNSIKIVTEIGKEPLWRGVYDTKNSRQITSIPEVSSLQLEENMINITEDNLEIIFSKGSCSVEWEVLSKMFANDVKPPILIKWKTVMIGMLLEVIGVCILLFKRQLIQIEKWFVGFFYNNVKELEENSLFIWCYRVFGVLFILIGLYGMYVANI